MRLEALHLEFFGHFSDKRFNFGSVSDDQTDFHVIYGPNEAGKTTFMEAYLRLLYGFLPVEPYGFVYQRKNLRVSGVLQINGTSKSFTRLPTKKGSLLNQDGAPLPEQALQASLGGLTMQDYRNLLCIDDETIEKGGEEIVNSEGDIGTLLFSAAAGISDLSSVLTTIRAQADLLYKRNSSRTKLADLKNRLKEIEKKIADQDVSAAQYKKLKAQLKLAESSRDAITAERAAMYREQNLLRKQVQALPLLHEVDELELALLPLAHYPEHLDIDPAQSLAMLSAEASASSEIRRRSTEIEQLESELKQINLDDRQLSIVQTLEHLQPLNARYTTARLGLDAERQTLKDIQQRMAFAAREFAEDEIDPVQLLVTPSVIENLNECIKSKQEAAHELALAKTELIKIDNSIREKKSALLALEPVEDDSELIVKIMEKFNAQVFLSEALAAKKQLAESERTFSNSLSALELKGQRFSSVPECSIHSMEAEEILRELATLEVNIVNAGSDKDKATERAQSLQSETTQLQHVQRLQGISDDQTVARLKQERNEAWYAHRKNYLPESADVFEAILFQLDSQMEGRVLNASTLGELRQLHQSVIDEQAKERHANDQIIQLRKRKKSVENTLAAAVSSAGLKANVSSALALGWIRECEQAATDERAVERVRSEQAAVLEKAQRLEDALGKYIVRDQASLQELVGAAQDIDTRYQEKYKQIVDQRVLLKKAEIDESNLAVKVSEYTQTLIDRNQAWQRQVSAAFPITVDPEKLEPVLSTLHTLRELDRDRMSALERIADMESSIELFSVEVESLSRQLQLQEHSSISETYEALKALAAQVVDANRRRVELTELVRKRQDSLAQAKTDQKTNDALKVQFANNLGSIKPSSSINELIAEERIAREAIQKRSRKSDTQKQLQNLLGLVSLDEARAHLDTLETATLEVRLRELDSEIEAIDERLKVATEHSAHCKAALDAVVGDATVAELDQQRTTLELEMSEVALEHLKLSLGHQLAQKAILQYREQHRSSMMKATESVFIELTNGAYTRLQTHTEGVVESLQVVQADGAPKSVHQSTRGKRVDASRSARSDLSKGTRFQLYLALRAAAYEQLAEQGTCLPFICDDIFETFDEQRTRAACRVLQRIGKTGQAIYLTHHQHVVDIAKEVCSENVSVHGLGV